MVEGTGGEKGEGGGGGRGRFHERFDLEIETGEARRRLVNRAKNHIFESVLNERFLQSILRRQEESDRWLLLLKSDENYIGFVHAKIDHNERPGWGYILEFYIVPDRRRRGWGRQLFHHMVGIFELRGITQVWLTSNCSAEAFWCSLGFKPIGEEKPGLKVMVSTIC